MNQVVEINLVSFCAGPEAENDFKVPCETLKHFFLGHPSRISG